MKNLKKLEHLAALPFERFSDGDPLDLAQHHLRLALEGGFQGAVLRKKWRLKWTEGGMEKMPRGKKILMSS